jgi:1-acyl-sn-glycerol-3-phosphate acyltransferase
VTLREEARRVVRVAGFGAVTAVMLPAYAARGVLVAPAEKGRVRDRWVRVWSRALLGLFAVRVDVRGAMARPPPGQGTLVVANHRSTIDIAVVLSTFGGHVLSRADLARWPLVGAAARKVGTVFVDRQDASSGASAVRAMRDLLRGGETVSVFAEGTTFGDDMVRPFHAGAFLAALRTGARVVPIGLAYEKGSGAAFVNESFPEHLARMSKAGPTRLVLRVGEPIAVADTARAAILRDEARAAVQALVDDARRIVDGGGAR